MSKEMEPMKHSVRFTALTVADSPLSSPTSSFDLDDDILSGVGNVDPKFQSLTEKGIRLLCSEFLELKKASAEEMRKNIVANYNTFIRTSQELGELELELSNMQTLINTHAVLVRDLLEGVHLQSTQNMIMTSLLKEENGIGKVEFENRLYALSDGFDVSLAECRVDDAVSTLQEVEVMVSKAQSVNLEPATIAKLTAACSEKRARLVRQLVNTVWEPSVHGQELRKLVSLLHTLGESSQAHTLLLKSYHMKIEKGVKNLGPMSSWYAEAYVTNLAQLYFSMILQASHNSLRLFHNLPGFASELVLWACKETEDYVTLVKKHILSPSVAASGITTVVDAIQVSLGYCTLLEDQGLSLGPTIWKSFKPCIAGVLDQCLRRIEEGITVYCASDKWVLTEEALLSVSWGRRKVHSTSSVKLSISAYKFLQMVQGLLEDATVLFLTQFRSLLLEGVLNVFGFYMKLLIKALRHMNEGEVLHMDYGVKLVSAELQAQQLAILGNAAALADELLPLSLLKWLENAHIKAYSPCQERKAFSGTQSLEQKEWRKGLQRVVDELRDTICEQHILKLLYDGNEKPFLTADLYLYMHEKEAASQNPMPSAPFQALLEKFHDFEKRAREVLAGRERVIVTLFMRLTEAFVTWLSNEECFWQRIEDTLNLFSPMGLQKFVFDMQFVIQIASTGRYASRKMHHTISAMISRAENAFSASDGPAQSVLQNDEWFEDKAKIALQMILLEIGDSVPDEQQPEEQISGCGPVGGENNLQV